ncbi:hypothetical protein FJZ20_01220 [Candidatus Pacearchaeota archaeon]|nr:hypothetical protein [Candidatus Pacearchaeota archaeon]
MTKKFLSDAEKEKILKKIAIKLKSNKKKSAKFKEKKKDEEIKKFPEKENLEEDFNENFNIPEFSSTRFSPDIETKAPALERIALSVPKPIFVGKIPQTSIGLSEEKKEKENSDYVTSNRADYSEKNREQIYELPSEKTDARTPERIDISRIGRELPKAISEEQENIRFQNFGPKIESNEREKAWTAKRINPEKLGRQNPLESEEEKYKTYKPKIPKGY